MERTEMSPSPTAGGEAPRGPRPASSQLIICRLTVYQSQSVSSCPRGPWIFPLYGLINFTGIISPSPGSLFLTNAAPHNVLPAPPPHPSTLHRPRLNASHDKQTHRINQMCFRGRSSLHYRREGSLRRVCVTHVTTDKLFSVTVNIKREVHR